LVARADRRDPSQSGRSGWENRRVSDHVVPSPIARRDVRCKLLRARPMVTGADVVAIGFGPELTAAAMLFWDG
jgi:hypothetical protein